MVNLIFPSILESIKYINFAVRLNTLSARARGKTHILSTGCGHLGYSTPSDYEFVATF